MSSPFTLFAAAHAVPLVIALGSPWHHRLSAAGAALLERLGAASRRRAAQRAARREAALNNALVASLDARTLRDLGLGDWAATPRSADSRRGWIDADPY